MCAGPIPPHSAATPPRPAPSHPALTSAAAPNPTTTPPSTRRRRRSVHVSQLALLSMLPEWPCASYDLLERNCHHWSAAAARALGVNAPPRWVNRAAAWMRFLRGAPAGSASDRDGSEQSWRLGDEFAELAESPDADRRSRSARAVRRVSTDFDPRIGPNSARCARTRPGARHPPDLDADGDDDGDEGVADEGGDDGAAERRPLLLGRD